MKNEVQPSAPWLPGSNTHNEGNNDKNVSRWCHHLDDGLVLYLVGELGRSKKNSKSGLECKMRSNCIGPKSAISWINFANIPEVKSSNTRQQIMICRLRLCGVTNDGIHVYMQLSLCKEKQRTESSSQWGRFCRSMRKSKLDGG